MIFIGESNEIRCYIQIFIYVCMYTMCVHACACACACVRFMMEIYHQMVYTFFVLCCPIQQVLFSSFQFDHLNLFNIASLHFILFVWNKIQSVSSSVCILFHRQTCRTWSSNKNKTMCTKFVSIFAEKTGYLVRCSTIFQRTPFHWWRDSLKTRIR